MGPKVAAFYLRDLAIVMDIDLEGIENRHLLQPVDIWVKRAVTILNDGEGVAGDEIANWIVRRSGQPELANMGMWYFSSQIARSEYRLGNVLSDLGKAGDLAAEHAVRVRSEHEKCESLVHNK